MGRKKFIDKKKSATFQLLARDSSSSSSYPAAGDSTVSDRVFVRVDNNPYICRGIFDDDDDEGDAADRGDNPNSVFADAPGDTDDEGSFLPPPPWIGGGPSAPTRAPLPDHVRREILELGLPDDGYNYLLHLREISNSGGGSAYYHNSKAKLERVPQDVKAYDASRLRICSEVRDEANGDSIDTVALKTVGVKIQKAVDPDVSRLLDDSDLSRFGSDVEDLDEDFVIKANLPEREEEEEEEEEEGHEKLEGKGADGLARDIFPPDIQNDIIEGDGDEELRGNEKTRVRRLLDEQFDLLTLREYDDDSGSDDVADIDTEGESLAVKLKDALKEYTMDDLELEDKYKFPGDFVHGRRGSNTGPELEISTDVIRRCVEYAEKYCDESQGCEEVVTVQESSDESEVWDCETIVSTYSNLDNHPGKIQAPEILKKKVPKNLPVDSITKNNVIALRGKEKLPVEFLPQNRRSVEKVKAVASSGAAKQKRRPHSMEPKEEKKERKAAVKEERREARRAKKEMKGLYRCEAQKAQKVAAVSGPSSMHLM